MSPRAAALAFAAPLLLAAPALADNGKSAKRSGATISVQTGNGSLYYNTGSNQYGYNHNRGHSRGHNRGYNRGYRLNEYGQRPREVKRLKQQAARACRRAIVDQAHYAGFRDIDFDHGRRVRQIAPAGFRVTFHEVEFEGRRRDFERPVTCTVRRATNVKHIEGIPQRGHRGHNRDRRHRY